MIYFLLRLALLSASLGVVSCKSENLGKVSNNEIRNSIIKYFGDDNPYLFKEDINFDEPNIVKITAFVLPKFKAASCDIYWVGKTQNTKKIRVFLGNEIIGDFKIENFEENTIDDPVAETYTGHGMFLLPLPIWDKIDGRDLKFILIDAAENKYGDLFVTKKPRPSKAGVFSMRRRNGVQ